MEFDAINLTDGWTKWKETMQLHPTASMNGKADNEKYGSIFHDWRKMERPFWILDLIAPFLGKIYLQVGPNGKSSQYYPVNVSVP